MGLWLMPLKAQENIQEVPSMAFIEYLAEMEEVNGKLYGPQDIATTHCQKLAQTQEDKKDETINEQKNKAQTDKKSKSSALKPECKPDD